MSVMEDPELMSLKEKVDRIDRRTRSIVAGAYAVIGLIAISSVVACTVLRGPGFAALLGTVLLVGGWAGHSAQQRAHKYLEKSTGSQPPDGSDAAMPGDGEPTPPKQPRLRRPEGRPGSE